MCESNSCCWGLAVGTVEPSDGEVATSRTSHDDRLAARNPVAAVGAGVGFTAV